MIIAFIARYCPKSIKGVFPLQLGCMSLEMIFVCSFLRERKWREFFVMANWQNVNTKNIFFLLAFSLGLLVREYCCYYVSRNYTEGAPAVRAVHGSDQISFLINPSTDPTTTGWRYNQPLPTDVLFEIDRKWHSVWQSVSVNLHGSPKIINTKNSKRERGFNVNWRRR